jgi:hypothetical protein
MVMTNMGITNQISFNFKEKAMLSAKQNVWMRDCVPLKEKIKPTYDYVEIMKASILRDTEIKMKALEMPYITLQKIRNKAQRIRRYL